MSDELFDELLASLTNKFRRLVELRDERDLTKKAYENAEKDYREKEAELYTDIEESPFSGSIPLELGDPYGRIVFTPRRTYYGKVVDAEKALEYLEQRAMIDDYTESKVVSKRLNEMAREHVEADRPLPEGFDFSVRQGITITREK